MDLLLVVPPFYQGTKDLTSGVKEYLGVAYLAAAAREKGLAVEILDTDLKRLNVFQSIKEITHCASKVIGFSVLQVAIGPTLEIIKGLRKIGIDVHITLGGHFPTFARKAILREFPEVDSIVVGEGELTLIELVERITRDESWQDIRGLSYYRWNRLVDNPPQALIEDLDLLPFPARDTLPDVVRQRGTAAMLSSRGCWGSCSFCSVDAFYGLSAGKKWRMRSPENIVEEIEYLIKEYRQQYIVFNDDNFIGLGSKGKERAYEIGDQIKKRRLDFKFNISLSPKDVDKDLLSQLKQAGLYSVFLGIESMNQRSLKLFNKKLAVQDNLKAIAILEDLGIYYQLGFIMFDPFITIPELKSNFTFLRERVLISRFSATHLFMHDLRVLEGTSLERFLSKEGLLEKRNFQYLYKHKEPLVQKVKELMERLVLKQTLGLMRQVNSAPLNREQRDRLRAKVGVLELDLVERLIGLLEKEGELSTDKIKSFIREIDAEIGKIHSDLFERRNLINPAETKISYEEKMAATF